LAASWPQVVESQGLLPQGRRGLASWVLGAVVLTACSAPDHSRVAGSEVRLTLAQDDGGNLAAVRRQDRPDVTLRVTLVGAPVGEELALACDWTDPSGQAARHNRYRTRAITSTLWPTHCHQLLGPDTAPGTWSVRMSLDDRQLALARFEVQP